MKVFTNHILNLKFDKHFSDSDVIQHIKAEPLPAGVHKILMWEFVHAREAE